MASLDENADTLEAAGKTSTSRRHGNTLFGSNLEHISQDHQRKMNAMDIEECGQKAAKYEAPKIRTKQDPKLPSDVAEDALAKIRQEVEIKRRNFLEAEERLRATKMKIEKMDHECKYDHPLNHLHLESNAPAVPVSVVHAQRVQPPAPRRPIVPRGGEVAAALSYYKKEPTKVGTSENHTYAYIGDLLSTGQHFDTRPVALMHDMKENVRVVPNKAGSKELRKVIAAAMPPPEHVVPGSGIHIAANLRHHFKSYEVDRLLGDKEKVEACWKIQQEAEQRRQRLRRVPQHPLDQLFENDKGSTENKDGRTSPNYIGMGKLTRTNVFGPSESRFQMDTTHRTTYTPAVIRRRDADMPHDHVYRRDSFTNWAEASVIANRINKELDQKMAGASLQAAK